MACRDGLVRAGVALTGDQLSVAVLGHGTVQARHVAQRGGDDSRTIRTALDQVFRTTATPTAITFAADTLETALARPAELDPVAVLRLAQPGGTVLPPMSGWPPEIRRAIGEVHATLPGGHDLSGRALAPLDRDGIRRFVAIAAGAGIGEVAVCAAGSCALPEHELQVAEWLRHEFTEIDFTLSHEVGGLGLRERENTAVLNSAVRRRAERLVTDAEQAVRALHPAAQPTFVTNDGAAVSAEYVRRFPAVTLTGDWAAGARGAAWLTETPSALVLDAQPRRVRAGLVVTGRPPKPTAPQSLHGIRLGTIIPEMVELEVFPDVPATLSSRLWGAPSAGTPRFPAVVVGQQARQAAELIRMPVDGWGPRVTELRCPPAAEIAAAIGAADTLPSATVERLVIADGTLELDRAVGALCEEALARVTSTGADPATTRIDDVRTTPVSYLPRGVHHITVRAVGDLPKGPTP